MEHLLRTLLLDRGYTAVPMARNVVGHLEIEVLVNGRALRFVVDTGASQTVLDAASAASLGLALEASPDVASGVGTASHAVQLARVDSFVVDSLELGPRPIAVIDLSHVSESLAGHGGTAIDGAIGGDILREHGGIIEYGAGMLYLLR